MVVHHSRRSSLRSTHKKAQIKQMMLECMLIFMITILAYWPCSTSFSRLVLKGLCRRRRNEIWGTRFLSIDAIHNTGCLSARTTTHRLGAEEQVTLENYAREPEDSITQVSHRSRGWPPRAAFEADAQLISSYKAANGAKRKREEKAVNKRRFLLSLK